MAFEIKFPENVHVPKIPNVRPFTPVRPQVNTSKLQAAGAAAVNAKETAELITLQGQLTTLKVNTVNGSLTPEEKDEATQLVAKLASKGKLGEADIEWCKKHGVPIP